MHELIVAVGSTNPTKITPVEHVFRHHFPNVHIQGVAVASGVADQPMTEEETYTGAYTRACAAIKAVPGATYGVGIEGGLQQRSYGWFEQSLVVIVNQEGQTGIGSSGGLVLPDEVIRMIHEGRDLEQAIDSLFGTTKIGQGIGMFGIMTNGLVTRASGVEHGVAFAIARFIHQDIYDKKS